MKICFSFDGFSAEPPQRVIAANECKSGKGVAPHDDDNKLHDVTWHGSLLRNDHAVDGDCTMGTEEE